MDEEPLTDESEALKRTFLAHATRYALEAANPAFGPIRPLTYRPPEKGPLPGALIYLTHLVHLAYTPGCAVTGREAAGVWWPHARIGARDRRGRDASRRSRHECVTSRLEGCFARDAVPVVRYHFTKEADPGDYGAQATQTPHEVRKVCSAS